MNDDGRLVEILRHFTRKEATLCLEAVCHYRDGLITVDEMKEKIDRAAGQAKTTYFVNE